MLSTPLPDSKPNGLKNLFLVVIFFVLSLSVCRAADSLEETFEEAFQAEAEAEETRRASARRLQRPDARRSIESGDEPVDEDIGGLESEHLTREGNEESDTVPSSKTSLLDEDGSMQASQTATAMRELSSSELSGAKHEHRRHHLHHHSGKAHASKHLHVAAEETEAEAEARADPEYDAEVGLDPAYLEVGPHPQQPSTEDLAQHRDGQQLNHQHQPQHHQHHQHHHHSEQTETIPTSHVQSHRQQQRRQSLHANLGSSFIEANGDIGNVAEGGGGEGDEAGTRRGHISNIEGEGVGHRQGTDKSLLEVADSLAEQMRLVQKTSKAFARAARHKNLPHRQGEHRHDKEDDSMFQEGMQQETILSPVPMSTFPHLVPIIGRVTGCLCCLAVLTTALCGKQGIWWGSFPGLATPASTTPGASPLQILGRNLAARARGVDN